MQMRFLPCGVFAALLVVASPLASRAADAPAMPKVPAGFGINIFAKAPDIKSPASLAVSADGKVFVCDDEYNTQPKREMGLSHITLCVDTDGDGVADKFTTFCDKLNAPQGMTCVGDTLFVVHAPLLTAFRDTKGTGVADVREDLITGLGPVPEGLVHHIPSGLRIGIDGWLYISIGDKGVVKATGKDGRTVSMWGGGVIRIRPDGTMLEVFSHHTRNTFDVAIDPYMNAFTRDNTNDGDGWDSRLAQMQRDAEYGYPSLFKHWGDEIVQPIASYGSGSATGSIYIQEPNLPGTYGDCLYACDWARGILYRHELKKNGATFEPTQEEFVKDIRPTDLDMDAKATMYIADWGRRDWGNSGPVGLVYRVATTRPTTNPTKLEPVADETKLTEDQLLSELASPSQIHRREAQWEILHRSPTSAPSPKLLASLTSVAMKKGELYARVAALFTLAQLGGDEAHGSISTIAAIPEMREFALRALADRDDQHYGINTNLFTQGLADPNPRVRVQAAIGIGHLGKPALAAGLVPLTADTDPMVRHAAMQSLRRLQAGDVCIAAMKDAAHPDIVKGAMRTARSFHDVQTVAAVGEVMHATTEPSVRQDGILALGRLYHVEGKWNGSWWTPHPDTRGPYYTNEPWAMSDRVAAMLIEATGDRDVPTAKMALSYIGLIEEKEAIPNLARMIAGGGPLKDDAASALIAIKASTPEALAALERVVLGDSFNPDVRGAAAAAISAIDIAKGQPIIVSLAQQLDRAPKLPAGLIEKVSDALSAHPPAVDQVGSLLPLLSATKEPVRIAAATALLRSTDPNVRSQVESVWKTVDDQRLLALLNAVTRVPPENSKPYTDSIRALLKDQRPPIHEAATIALGHIGDAGAVKDLITMAKKEVNPLPAVSALAGIEAAKTADDQVFVIATLLVDDLPKAKKADDAMYARFIGAAQKYLSDPRVPADKAATMRNKLMEPGVIFQYMRSDPIPVPAGAAATFTTVFPPEEAVTIAGATAASLSVPFSANGKQITWSPMSVSDPKGMQVLGMPENSVEYFTATYEAKTAGSGLLTTGSDDGLHVWLNGKSVISKNIDRGLVADMDQEAVPLIAGKNTLLFRVNNMTDGSGIQARLRSRAIEFMPDEFAHFNGRFKKNVAHGKELFTSLGCVKCHTIDKHEEPKGPYLGDVGAKFQAAYLCESIMRPSAKIAQGFDTVHIVSQGASSGDYLGFITKETADEVDLRDPSGKVTVVKKSDIKTRAIMPGSMMPEGLVDNLSCDEFASLIGFLQSMK